MSGREGRERCTAFVFRVTLTCLATSAEAPTAAVVPIAARALRTALKRGVLCSANDRWRNERPPWKLGGVNERLLCAGQNEVSRRTRDHHQSVLRRLGGRHARQPLVPITRA
jgi:hypothetical protein